MKHRPEDWKPAVEEYADLLDEIFQHNQFSPSLETSKELRLQALDAAIESEAEGIRKYLERESNRRLAKARKEAAHDIYVRAGTSTAREIAKAEMQLSEEEEAAIQADMKNEFDQGEIDAAINRIWRLKGIRDFVQKSPE